MTKDNADVTSEMRRSKGFLNPSAVKGVVFTVMTLCVVFGVLVSILAIWDFAKQDVLWRTLSTLGVIWLGCLVFSIINTKFGD